MKGLSVIIPCYNEDSRGNFKKRVQKVQDYLKELDTSSEVILVNDGSSDDTALYCTTGYTKNKGKGYAIRWGISQAKYDIVLVMDADLSVSLSNIKLFYELCESGTIIIGTRVFKDTRSWMRRKLTELSKFCCDELLNLNIKDTQCGFKMFNKEDYEIVKPYLKCNRWLFDIELLVYLKKFGVSVIESNVSWRNDPNSRLKSFSALVTSGVEFLSILKGKRIYEK